MNPVHAVASEPGVAASATEALKPRVGAANTSHDVEIGAVYDSSDDMVRLMLVTSYAGTKDANVFIRGADATGDEISGTRVGRLSLDDGDAATTDVNNVRLRSEGRYYRAGDDTTSTLAETDVVAPDAELVEVFSYVDPGDDTKKYAVKTLTTTDTDGTTYRYTAATILFDHDGVGTTDTRRVQVELPEKTDYDHIHFGVWAALDDADNTSGLQEVDGLGTGFVHNHDGSGMTETMPNHGSATYEGDWTAAVQAEDEDGEGAITLQHGAASMAANFGMGKVTVSLIDLATLEGTIDGSTFAGSKDASFKDTNPDMANDQAGGMGGLDITGEFEGTLQGAFYGTLGAEAGGVFDYKSDDMEEGAFRGAFGGAKVE